MLEKINGTGHALAAQREFTSFDLELRVYGNRNEKHQVIAGCLTADYRRLNFFSLPERHHYEQRQRLVEQCAAAE